MPDGFSFAEALQPAQPRGFSFAEALAPPPSTDSKFVYAPGDYAGADDSTFNQTEREPRQPASLPTADEARAWLAPEPNTIYGSPLNENLPMGGNPLGAMFSPFARDATTGATRLTIPPAIRSLALGALDVGQGRVMVDDPNAVDAPAPDPVYGIRPTPDTVNLAGLAAGKSPASGTGMAIRDAAELGAPADQLYRPRVTAMEVQARDGVGIMEAWNRAHAENNAAAIGKIGQATDINGAIVAAGDAVKAPAWVAPSGAAPDEAALVGRPGIYGGTPDVTKGPFDFGAPAAADAAAPGPQSAGAAASRDLALPGSWELTPKQTAAYRSTAEGKKLLESQEPGVPDYNEYVRGVIANTAEQEQTVNTARELKSLNMTAPEVGQEARDIRFANNEKRASHLSDTIKSPVDVANAVEDLRLQDESQLADVWQNKADADAQPMLDTAARITTSPDGRRPLVRRVVSSVLKELYDENGELLTDPEQLYGVRKHIDDLMDEQDAGGGKKNARAMSALIKLKNTLDNEVIEPAAGGFGQYLSDHADAARKIDEMTVLQGHEAKLFDAQNYLTYNRFQTMMRQIVDSRQARGLNDYKSITPETMQRLWALRDDLRRSASAIELARTTGSDSAQNLWDMVKGAAAGHLGTAAASGVGMLIGGPIGAGIGGTLKLVGNSLASGRTARIQTARGMEMLNPPRTLTPPTPD